MSLIALLYSALATDSSTAGIREALIDAGHKVVPVAAGPNLVARICEVRPDVIFNNAPGLRTKSEQPHIVSMLELTGIPFTGSGLAAQVICQHKGLTKRLLKQAGVATASFAILRDRADVERLRSELAPAFTYPALVKPEAEGSSRGIGRDSVVTAWEALAVKADRLFREFGGSVLVEEFLPGREFTVGVIGDGPEALPPVEILFDGTGFYAHDIKEADSAETVCPAQAKPELVREVQALAIASFRAVGARDYARVDIRLNAADRPAVIEVNAQPGLTPGYSDFPKAAGAAGISFPDLVARLTECALQRGRQLSA